MLIMPKHTVLFGIILCALLFLQQAYAGIDTDIENLVAQVDSTNLRTHIQNLCEAGGHRSRISFTDGNYAAADYIFNYLSSLPGLSRVQRDTFFLSTASYPYNGYPLINIIAEIDGQEPDSGMVIVGAHYDASASHEANWEQNWQSLWAQGADDNATGVAAVLEMARIFSENSGAFEHTNPIRFITFAAEEYHPVHPNNHHLGSLYDAQKCFNNGIKIKSMLALDMFGYNPGHNYVELISDAPSLPVTDLFYNSRDNYVPELETNPVPVDVPYSDHDSYQQYGYRAILLMENDRPWNDDLPYYSSNPFYHSESDQITTLNFSLIQDVSKLALAATAEQSKASSTAIVQISREQPRVPEIVLYPNPANPVAHIEFDLLSASDVSIKIFNVAGQQVAHLANREPMHAGHNTFTFDVTEFSSGIYFISVQTVTGVAVKRLTVAK